MNKIPAALPEAIMNRHKAKQPWQTSEVQPIQASVNLKDCKALLPRNVNEYTDLIHWHEMGHVRYDGSPNIFGNTEPGIFDHILREPALNARLERDHGVDVSQATRALDWTTQPMPTNARDAAVLWINLSYYLKDARNESLREFAGRLEDLLATGIPVGAIRLDQLVQAVKEVMRDPANETLRQTWAVKLAELFAPPPPPPDLKPELAPDTKEAMEEAEEAEREAAREEAEERGREEAEIKLAGGRIGRMEIHEHLSLRRPGHRITSPGKAVEIGTVPQFFHRWCSDKQLFRARKATGAVVIDCSGSMHWDWAELKRGLKSFPNVVVACYTGFADDQHGRLCVIARKGRWSNYDPQRELIPGPGWGNNTVDHEALTWLASQPRPRVWLSDGQVCGGDRRVNSPAVISDLMRRARIIRVAGLDATIAYFQGKSVPAFTRCQDGATVLRKK